MRLAIISSVLAVGYAVAQRDIPVIATFRDIPISLPPLGEPVSLKARGSYDIKLVHQWPPLQFDRWSPIEYYEPYGYVYECEDDGQEYIFDSQATRPVIREVVQMIEPAVLVDSAIAEPIFSFAKPSAKGVEIALLNNGDVAEPVGPMSSLINSSLTTSTSLPLEVTYTQPAKHLHLRGFVDALTFLPATLFKDAIIQGRAILVGKERKLFDLDRLFGDVLHRECARDGLCTDAAETWLSYVAAIQEHAANIEHKITAAYRESLAGTDRIDLFEDELVMDCGRALVKKIENARLMLMKECESLPNVVDKSRLVQLLVTPLEYLQNELEDKSNNVFDKKQELGKISVDLINKHSAKMEKAIAITMEQLIRFPRHILQDVRQDIKLEY